jgi:hypothetical protein
VRVRRRNLRNALVAIGCLVATVTPAGLASAAVLLVVGSGLHFWSKGCLEQNQRLVTTGPYRFTRNPFYLANLLIDLGLCALVGRVWVVVPYVVLWWIAYRDTIRREEARLAELFPGPFERYVEAVPKLIPTGRMLPQSEGAGRFDLANPALAQGSEYARIFGVWVAAATIVAWHWIRQTGLAIFSEEHSTGLGVLVLVTVAWVLKLALAEVFRNPELALLPFAKAPARRWLVTFALLAAVFAAIPILDRSSWSLLASIGWLLILAASAVLSRAGASGRLRGLMHVSLMLVISLLTASRGMLWLAGGPLLWVALAGLDASAVERLRHHARVRRDQEERDAPVERRLWAAFPRIAVGGIIALLLIALGRGLA